MSAPELYGQRPNPFRNFGYVSVRMVKTEAALRNVAATEKEADNVFERLDDLGSYVHLDRLRMAFEAFKKANPETQLVLVEAPASGQRGVIVTHSTLDGWMQAEGH